MRVAVLGPGGVGGLVAALLSRAGHQVTVLVRPGTSHPGTIQVESQALGTFEAPVTVADRLAQPVDVLFVCVKAMHLEPALGQAPAPLVEGPVVPLLNGLDHVAILEAVYGAGRVVPGTIRVESERLGPGRVLQRGAFVAVELAGEGPLVEAVLQALNAQGVRATRAEDGVQALWSKLSMLAPLALTSTASGLDVGGIRTDPVWRGRLEAAMREVAAVAASEGHTIEPPFGFLDVAHPSMRTSMQKDAAAGRPLEVDHLTRPILDGGRRHAVPTPVIEELVALIKAPRSAG